MRTTWNGSLTFGLVSIPVGLAPATKPAARQSDVSFRLLHRECLTPIKQKRWCPQHDRELAPDEIVKGWEAAKGQYIVVEEAELEALEGHDDSRSIEISQFVAVEDVDPVFRDRTYYLVPGRDPRTAAPVPPAPGGDAGDGNRRSRPVRALRAGIAVPRAGPWRRSRAGDAVPRRGRVLRRRDRRGGRDVGGQGARARARTPDHRQPRRCVRAGSADELLPARPAGAARGQAAGRRAASAERGRGAEGPGGRSARGAQGERRGCEGRHRETAREGEAAAAKAGAKARTRSTR